MGGLALVARAILNDRRTPLVFSALFLASMLGVLVSATSDRERAQNDVVRRLRLQDFKDAPLVLREVRHLEADTWYNDVEIELKNTSSKPIYYVLAYLDFPDVPVPSAGIYGLPLDFGADQNIDYRRNADPNDPFIKPGETLVFRIPESMRKGLKTQYEKTPDAMKRLELRLNVISFGDGTGFVAERHRDGRIKKGHAEIKRHHRRDRATAADSSEPPQDGCGTCSRYILAPKELR